MTAPTAKKFETRSWRALDKQRNLTLLTSKQILCLTPNADAPSHDKLLYGFLPNLFDVREAIRYDDDDDDDNDEDDDDKNDDDDNDNDDDDDDNDVVTTIMLTMMTTTTMMMMMTMMTMMMMGMTIIMMTMC